MDKEFSLSLYLIILISRVVSGTGHFHAETSFNDSFFIPRRLLSAHWNQSSGSRLVDETSSMTLSLDERCKRGRSFSMAWFQYPPYTITAEARMHTTEEPGVALRGMLPEILKDILKACCNQSLGFRYAIAVESSQQIGGLLQTNDFDFVFPLHSFGTSSVSFRGRPFVAIVQAPHVVLLVPESTSRQGGSLVFLTIARAWPLLSFLMLMALIASFVVWFLDHNINPAEFPPSFLRGVWEGFWWSLVTMTTVGYGDRCPESFLGRLFAVAWILGGLCLVSIFTALSSSALSASTQPNYRKHGALIGALKGSKEFRLGVDLNADVKGFDQVEQMIRTLTRGEIDGALLDNFVITQYTDILLQHSIRIEEQIKHPVTYGMALGQGSSELETCARRYIHHHPQEVFETFSKYLAPLKNPTDYVSSQSKAAKRLFFQERIFAIFFFIEVAILVILFFTGLIWEFSYRRQRIVDKNRGTNLNLFSQRSALIGRRLALIGQGASEWRIEELNQMIHMYQDFHRRWIDKLKAMKDAGMFKSQVPV